jgi:hypothetical protein
MYTSLSSCGGVGGHHIYKDVHVIMVYFMSTKIIKQMNVQQYAEEIQIHWS